MQGIACLCALVLLTLGEEEKKSIENANVEDSKAADSELQEKKQDKRGLHGWEGDHGHHHHEEKTVTIVKKVPVPYPVEKHIPVPVEKVKHYPVHVHVPKVSLYLTSFSAALSHFTSMI